MGYIIDKTMLVLFCAYNVLMCYNTTEALVAILIATAFGAVTSYVESYKAKAFYSFLFGFFAVFYTPLSYMAPVIFYEIIGEHIILSGAFVVITTVFNVYGDSFSNIFLLIVTSVLAAWLFYNSRKKEIMSKTIKKIRDDSQERNILLDEKNRHLIEKQDQEIYVATLRERNRIARDIHDNVGHIITRTILQMGALMTIYKEEPVHGQLEAVKDNLDIAMNNIRNSVHDIHDEAVDLRQSIEEIIKPLDGKFQVKLDYDVSDTIPKEHKYAIIGIVKEAVTNIIKHSKNDNVDIFIREHPSLIQLMIYDYPEKTDDTLDISSKVYSSDGIGISNIEDRVSRLNGYVSIDTKAGFKIFITLPRGK